MFGKDAQFIHLCNLSRFLTLDQAKTSIKLNIWTVFSRVFCLDFDKSLYSYKIAFTKMRFTQTSSAYLLLTLWVRYIGFAPVSSS